MNLSPRNHRSQHPPRRLGTGGFALVEALIGMLIFAIGILGMVGLQAAMVQAQGSAKFRADAAVLASEIIGSMWSDVASNRPNYVSASGTPCTSTTCTQWLAKLASSLPGGTATISIDGANVTTITITWTLPADGAHSYVTSTSIL
ncbi:MAG: type IV pilus modification PilV family protein [Rhodoferax sp.]